MSDRMIQEPDLKKSYLKRYRKNRELIYRLKNKISKLDERMTTLRSPGLSDMPRGGTPVTFPDLLAERSEIEERIERLELKGRKLKAEILDKIDELEDSRYAEVLESYFVECRDFGDIAEDNGYTIRHVLRLYTEAINAMSV